MHFESPKASAAIQSLIGSINKHGLDSESFRRLLWLINAHPTLIGHGQVFANVLALLQTKSFHIDALDWASDWKKDVSSWIEVCTWITSQRLEISLLPGLDGLNRAPSGRHPLVGEGVDRHAVAAALWSRHESAAQYPPQTFKSGKTAWVFFEIQGHLLASYADARYRFSSLEFFENYSHDLEQPVAPIRTGPIGLAMREFSRQKYAPMLAQIKPNSRTPDFALALCATTFDFSVVSDDVGDDSDRYLASTVRYFRRVSDVLSGWKPSAANRRGGGGGGGHARRHGFVHVTGPEGVYLEKPSIASQDPDIPTEGGRIIGVDLDLYADIPDGRPAKGRAPKSTSSSIVALEESGLAPSESTEEIFRLYTADELKERYHKLRQQRLAAESHAQSLPFDYAQLTPHEIHQVNAEANSRIAAQSRLGTEQAASAVLAIGGLIVQIMLCLGQPLTKARALTCKWIVGDTLDQEIEVIGDGPSLVVRAPSQGDWGCAEVIGFCLPGVMPHYQTTLPSDLEEIDREAAHSFVLPDIHGLGQQLLDFMRASPSTGSHVFGLSQQSAMQTVKDLIQACGNPRITPEKISRVMSNIIYQLTGDKSTGWLTLADTQNANQSRMHYTRLPVSKILDTYMRASRRLAKYMGIRIQVPACTLTQRTTASVGARFVIALPEVRDLVGRLVARLHERYRKHMTERELRRYHSLYILYTSLYQSLLTSLRATSTPQVLYNTWIQSEHQMALVNSSLSDKDSSYSDRARLVPILPALGEQYEHLTLHWEWLGKRLTLSTPWIDTFAGKHPFFVLNADYRVEPLSPDWIRGALKEYTGYDIPTNFNRAFLRTELLDRGCGPQSVDALLGHANLGELPFSKLSTFDFSLHFQHIRRALQSLHDDIGLRPIGSRLVPHGKRVGIQ